MEVSSVSAQFWKVKDPDQSDFWEGDPRDAEFKFLTGGNAQNFEIDGGQCPPWKIWRGAMPPIDGGQKNPKTHFLLHF